MSKRTLIIVGILVVASVGATMAIERRAANRQRAQAEALEEQAAQIAQAAAEDERLTNLVAKVAASQSLSPEQLTDLLRLRNEVRQLHKLEGQKAQLEASNAQLRELDKKSRDALASAQALPNYWPREQLAFAGYAAPESTVKSMLAAMKNGDLKALKDCFDPSNAPPFDAEPKDGVDRAVREAEVTAMLGEFVRAAEGFHIIDQTATGSNEMTINLSVDGAGRVEKMVLRKFGNDWKLVN
jgi:hypothetical protein